MICTDQQNQHNQRSPREGTMLLLVMLTTRRSPLLLNEGEGWVNTRRN